MTTPGDPHRSLENAGAGQGPPGESPSTRSRRGRLLAVLAVAVIALLGGLVTCAIVKQRPAEGPSIVGTWRNTWRVQQTGPDEYTGIGLTDAIEPDSGCPYRAGEVEWRIKGKAPAYEGEERWVKGSRGQNCEYDWGQATFTLLDDGQTVEVCSTSPWNASERPCRKLPRTDASSSSALRLVAKAPGRL